MRIYKIFRLTEWRDLEARKQTEGSPDDRRDGFMHFSREEQLEGTLAKHFAGEGDLMLAACEGDAFGEALRWENGFPHLYRSLSREDVVWHAEIPPEGIDRMTLGQG